MIKNFQKVYSREESDVGSSSDSYILRTLEKENHILSILKHGKSNFYFYSLSSTLHCGIAHEKNQRQFFFQMIFD